MRVGASEAGARSKGHGRECPVLLMCFRDETGGFRSFCQLVNNSTGIGRLRCFKEFKLCPNIHHKEPSDV